MAPSNADPNLLGQIVEEWQERLRRGERPELEEYVRRYPQLADEIRELFPGIVALEDLKGDVLNQTVAPSAVMTVAETRRLERVGDYRILREIGRGGMGVVYEAEQESLGRRVALKILPAGALLDPRQQKRFQREAKAAARLHHTNIVPVYGVGDHEGIHYYVMQFIQGLGLDRVLSELRRGSPAKKAMGGEPETVTRAAGVQCGPDIAAVDVANSLVTGRFIAAALPSGSSREEAGDEQQPPTLSSPAMPPSSEEPVVAVRKRIAGFTPSAANALSESGREFWRSVARIGIQVAEALEYAASQGVLHRDIKPSNLLLDTQGNVWVTDFGLAKASGEGDDLTHTGDIVGTLRYMAPERFEGRSDVRGDVYSLGLTLYEMLVRQPAFPETERNRLIHQVTSQSPPAPRKLNSAIPRDLETIVLKAIARDPAHRYATAGAFAADLSCFVEDRPIRARRVRMPERFWRWCRRNPTLAGLTASLVVLLVALAIVSTAAALHFEKLAQKESAARAEAVEAHDREAAQHRQAEANFARARRAVDDSFTKVSESQLLTVPGLQPLRHDLLQSARTFYEEFVRERGDDPALRVELAAAQLRLGLIDSELGFSSSARRSLDGAIAAYETALRDHPNDLALKEALGEAWNAVGQLYWDNNNAESRKAYEHSAQVCEELLRVDPANDSYKKALAKAYNGLGVMQTQTGRGADGLRSYLRCLDLRQELVQRHPDDPTLIHALSESLHNIAVRLGAGREEERLALYRRANAYNRIAFALMPHVIEYGIDLSTNYGEIARTYAVLQRPDEAITTLQQNIGHLRRMARDNPAVPQVHTRLIATLRLLAIYQRTAGNATEAQAALKQAREVVNALPRNGPDNLFTRACVRAAGAAQIGQGSGTWSNEELAEKKRDEDQAMADLQQAIAAGFRDVTRLRSARELTTLRSRQDYRELVAKLAKMPAASAAAAVVETPSVEGSKKPAAEAMTKDQLRAALASGHYAIGLVQVDLGQANEAVQTLTKALAVGEALVRDNPDNPQFQAELAEMQMAFGSMHWKQGRLAEADKQWQAGLKRLREASAAHPKDKDLIDRLAAAHAQLYEPYIKEHLWEEAAAHLGKAFELNPDNHWRAYRLAPLLLQAGDKDGYQRHRQVMLERFSTTDRPEMAERTAKACLLTPLSGTPLEQATKLADKSVADKKHWVLPYGMFAKSLADYRNARFTESVTTARDALGKVQTWNMQISSRYVLAMALQGAGKPKEALQDLRVADGRYAAILAQEANISIANMHDWLICVLLRREAHERIPGLPLPEDRSEHLRRAKAFAQLGQAKKTEKELQAVLAGQEDKPRSWITCGQVLAEAGQREAAQTHLTKAKQLLDKAPENVRTDASLWHELAAAWKANGQSKEAVEVYRHALSLQRRTLEAGTIPEPGKQLLRDLYGDLILELRAAGQTAEADALTAEMWKVCEAHGINPVQMFKGHTHTWVEGVAVLAEGKHALSWGYDGFVRLWDITSGQELRTYPHDSPIRGVDVASDGRRFLTASHDCLVRLWDVQSGAEVRRFPGHSAGVLTVAFVPGGREAVSGGTDSTVLLWDIATGRELRRFVGHTQPVMRVAVTPDGRRILSSSLDKTVRLWDKEVDQEVRRLEGYGQAVRSLAVSPDGRQALAGDESGLLILWDLETGKEVRRFTENRDWGPIRGIRFLNEGRQALLCTAANAGGLLLRIDLTSGKELLRIKGPAYHAQMALLPDGRHVLTADGDKMVRVWSLPLGDQPVDNSGSASEAARPGSRDR